MTVRSLEALLREQEARITALERRLIPKAVDFANALGGFLGQARNFCLNPGGISGTGWATGPGMSAVYSPSLSPVWTLNAAADAYIVVPFAPFVAGNTYHFRVVFKNVSGAIPSTITVIQAGSLPFAGIGSMLPISGGWLWEGSITPAANAASPTLWFALSAPATGGKTTLADFVICEENHAAGPAFDGGSGGNNYVTAWTGTAYASISTAYRKIHP